MTQIPRSAMSSAWVRPWALFRGGIVVVGGAVVGTVGTVGTVVGGIVGGADVDAGGMAAGGACPGRGPSPTPTVVDVGGRVVVMVVVVGGTVVGGGPTVRRDGTGRDGIPATGGGAAATMTVTAPQNNTLTAASR